MQHKQSHRRIRFAPLPDPRRSVVVADDGSELPIPDDSHLPAATSLAVLSDAQVVPPAVALPSVSDPDPSYHRTPRSFSLLKPFKRHPSSSSSSLTPTPSIDSERKQRKSITTEQILTLGTIHFFRSSSHNNTGWRTSSRPSSKDSSHVPLVRTQSPPPSSSSKRRPMSAIFSSSSPSDPNSSHPPLLNPPNPKPNPPPRHKGARLLNGRIYGAKRSNSSSLPSNPFATARDDEPEFVEWGYGGMGSVKGAKSAGVSVGPGAGAGGVNWERLHGPVVKGFGGGGRRGGWTERRSVEHLRDEEDDDDGSGLAWARKRKEKRAREAKEREEKSLVPSEEPEPKGEPQRKPSVQSVVENEEQNNVLHAVSSVRVPMSPHRKASLREGLATTECVNDLSEGDSEGSSESESEEESGEADGEEETTEEKRRTALGAGVEKVSRHRE